MAGAKLTIGENAIANLYEKIKDRTARAGAAMARDAYQIYVNAQRKRWMTENASEGSKWKALADTPYKKYKPKRFVAYPGGGRKLMIATSNLVKSVVGDDRTYHKLLIEERSITIATTLPYAKYVAEVRPIFEFSEETKKKIREKMVEYILS